MKREVMVEQLKARGTKPYEVLVIGGGASGLGAALEAASRGFDTLLLEQTDFAKGTSSRSTKLIHGGVRYLAQGDIAMVYEALHERGLLMKNAPHLVSNQRFIIPNYDWWEGPYYTLGLKIYDMMAGKLGLGPSVGITKTETIEAIPNIKTEGLRGGVIYQDGQFDDARLAVNLAQTIADLDGTILNHFKVTGLLKNEKDIVNGVIAIDQETGKSYELFAKAVINATGVFVDDILKMDDPESRKTIVPSQGVHIVLNREFLEGDTAVLIPRTDDGRVLFAVPWCGKVVVGTTDTLVKSPALEPRALEEEVKFILKTAGDYLTRIPTREDVKSVFAGLRPLVAPKTDGKKTKEISRGHKVIVSLSGLITMTGGKWTTYRKMGEDTIDQAIIVAGLDERISSTRFLPIHGHNGKIGQTESLRMYGSDGNAIKELIRIDPTLSEKLHPDLNFIKAQVLWAVREEMARTVEDVLARRVRALFLDARAAMEMAPEVARLLARELNWSQEKIDQEIQEFNLLAEGYLLK
jgi:glycerol-3-phosphate dehydrogenase